MKRYGKATWAARTSRFSVCDHGEKQGPFSFPAFLIGAGSGGLDCTDGPFFCVDIQSQDTQ